MAAAPPAVAVNGGGMAAAKVASQAYLGSKAVKDTRVLIADLCKQFYTLGWVSGTGGSITIKAHDDSIPKRQQLILMSPSGNTNIQVLILLLFKGLVYVLKVCIFMDS
jgi:methylthioribulose 1-phosphate dehydratase/enolase-phosphatase E1